MNTCPTCKKLARQVANLRHAQRNAMRLQTKGSFKESIRQAHKVDELVQKILDDKQQTLWG